MTIDTAVTVFREIAIGQGFACRLDHFPPSTTVVTVPLRGEISGRYVGSVGVDEIVKIICRFNLQAVIDEEQGVIVIGDDFTYESETTSWLVKN